jgi:hypothetical protein
MSKYSVLSLIKNAFNDNKNWERAWRDPEPKKNYDVIIIGAGGPRSCERVLPRKESWNKKYCSFRKRVPWWR